MNEDDRFKLLIDELEDALPHMHATLDQAIEGQQRLRANIDMMLREAGLRACARGHAHRLNRWSDDQPCCSRAMPAL